jgi:hypothetical protein
MNDAQRYRMNAAECLSAAEGCELPCRGLTLAIAESWLSLARLRHADKRRPIGMPHLASLAAIMREA